MLTPKVTGELVEKHTHLRAPIPRQGTDEAARRTMEMIPEDERRIVQRIAVRGCGGSNARRPIAEEIREILDPSHKDRLRVALADRLASERR